MTLLAHELPTGKVVYSTTNNTLLAWLQAGRTPDDLRAYVENLLSQGVELAEAQRHLSFMLSKDGEIANRSKDTRYTLGLITAWAAALAEGRKTRQEALDLIARISVPDTVRWTETQPLARDISDYRFDKRFDASGNLQWDMIGARETHKNKLRSGRVSKLAALDIEYYRADEAGDTVLKAQIVAKKQTLRDVTADPRINRAQTPEELVAVVLP